MNIIQALGEITNIYSAKGGGSGKQRYCAEVYRVYYVMLSEGFVKYKYIIIGVTTFGMQNHQYQYIIVNCNKYCLLGTKVGDGESDHYCWERAEDMTTPREAYKVDQSHPGSDVAAETAAALAASSIAFHPYNSTYSDLLLLHAKQVNQFSSIR